MFKDKLVSDNLWIDYLNSKLEKNYINKQEKESIKDFVINKKYIDITYRIINNNYHFSYPIKHLINKNHGNKKRIVYTYKDDEVQILKYIAYLLYEYDYLFSKNLYSFRKTIGVKNAINSLIHTKNINKMYGYKVDIKNYFNSINKDILLNNLINDIEPDLYNLIYELLNSKCIYNNEIINEDMGVIAGSPISSFLANYYLRDIDNYFWNEHVFYIRYADDIIIFSNTKEELIKYKNELNNRLNNYKLMINKEKEYFYNPGDTFEFLGFSFNNKKIDLSSNTIYKIKGKIKRTARGLHRWMIKNDANTIGTIKAMNRKYNKKFYGNDNSELSWKYYFFPIINTDKSLKLIDKYYQDEIRYMVTGKHNKKNYKVVPYSLLKSCNYKPLVHEYYKLKFDMINKL